MPQDLQKSTFPHQLDAFNQSIKLCLEFRNKAKWAKKTALDKQGKNHVKIPSPIPNQLSLISSKKNL